MANAKTKFNIGGSVVSLPVRRYSVADTYVLTPPIGAVGVDIRAMGAGGSGAYVVVNSRACGGAAGNYAHIRRAITDTDTLTLAVGTGGAGQTTVNTAGNAGGSTTATDGTWTLTVPGGGGGGNSAVATLGATPTISDGGAIETAIGGRGAAVTLGNNQGTGGGSPGGPWGDGKDSGGMISNHSHLVTGGASPFASSGNVGNADYLASGGAGRFKSANVTSATNASGGGGSQSAQPDSTILLPGLGLGDAAQDANQMGPIHDLYPADIIDFEGGGMGGLGSTSGNVSARHGGADAGGGGGYLSDGGNGGIRGGGGAAVSHSTTPARGGNGGRYAGGGAAFAIGSGLQIGGNGGTGAGGGGAGGSGGTVRSGAGGDGEILLTWLVGVPTL